MHYVSLFLLILPNVLSARLKMARGQRGDEPPDWTPSAGPLTHITATLPGRNIHKLPTGEYVLSTTTAVHEAIKVSADLESLSLYLALFGCTGFPDRWSLPFNLEGGETYPPIKHLCLRKYKFGDSEFERVGHPPGVPLWHSYAYEWERWVWSGNAKKWWEWRKMPAAQHLKTNAELWVDAMDWSQLQALELRDLSGDDFIKHISPRLAELKELTLDGFCSKDTTAWLTTLRPLKRLAWLGGCNTEQTTLDALLERHGSTLESLEIHAQLITWLSSFVSTSQVQKISQLAPKLIKVAFAVKRNGTWPLETLEAISRMPQLETAEIWMEYIIEEGYQNEHYFLDYELHGLGIEDNEETRYTKSLYQKPLLNMDNITELWEFMKQASSGRLKSVSFRAGDFTGYWNGPVYRPRWTDRQHVEWICDAEGCRRVSHHGFDETDGYVLQAANPI